MKHICSNLLHVPIWPAILPSEEEMPEQALAESCWAAWCAYEAEHVVEQQHGECARAGGAGECGGVRARAGVGGARGLQRAHQEATAPRQRHLAPHPQSPRPGCDRLPPPHTTQALHSWAWQPLSSDLTALVPTPA